jgi:hypothetical protein
MASLIARPFFACSNANEASLIPAVVSRVFGGGIVAQNASILTSGLASPAGTEFRFFK